MMEFVARGDIYDIDSRVRQQLSVAGTCMKYSVGGELSGVRPREATPCNTAPGTRESAVANVSAMAPVPKIPQRTGVNAYLSPSAQIARS